MSIVRDGIFGSQPLGDRNYLLLIASNIGAVIMPWMIFYQQSATVDKKLKVADLNYARFDTALGAVATQIIMIAIIVTTAPPPLLPCPLPFLLVLYSPSCMYMQHLSQRY